MARPALVVLAALVITVGAESSRQDMICKTSGKFGYCLPFFECIDPRIPLPPITGSPVTVECPFFYLCCPTTRTRRQVSLPAAQPTSFAGLVPGTPVLSQRKKYMALIGYGPQDNIDFSCEGAVISPLYVLAAAHCAHPPILGPARWVRAGDVAFAVTKDLKTVERGVERIIPHPEYDPTALTNDIALFRLDRDLDLKVLVRPVCLPLEPTPPGKSAVVIGWGSRDDDLTKLAMGHHLIQETVEIFNDTFCHELFDKSLSKKIDSTSMFCAGKSDHKNDYCAGDSSGPLVVEGEKDCPYTLIGLASFSESCAPLDAPTVYTRVSYFQSWIREVAFSEEPSTTTTAEDS